MSKRRLRTKQRRFPPARWPLAVLLGAIAAVVVSRGRSVISAAPQRSRAAFHELSTDMKTTFGRERDTGQPSEAGAGPNGSETTAPRAAGAATAEQPSAATTAPSPPETTAAGEDRTGTFRPTRAETDQFGVVLTDSEAAGLQAIGGWVKGDGSGKCPEDYPIKGNANSRIYHRPGEPSYEQTNPEICFADASIAEKAGYRPRKS